MELWEQREKIKPNQGYKYCFRPPFVCRPFEAKSEPKSHTKNMVGARPRAGSTAVPAGTPQEGQTARPDLPPASMAQANPGGGNKGLGRHL